MKVLEVRKNQKVRISKEHCATNNTYKRHFFKQIKEVCKGVQGRIWGEFVKSERTLHKLNINS